MARNSLQDKVAASAETLALPALIRNEADLAAASRRLLALDGALFEPLIAAAGPPLLRLRAPDFASLAWIVVSQQVSTASAEAIHARLRGRFADLSPGPVSAATDDELRACGLSAPKIRTLHAMAEAALRGDLNFAALAGTDVDAARAALLAIKGIGPWTADLFLLSCLGHPDAWPAGDLALQEAVRRALRLRSRPDAARMETLSRRWRPVRAVAARVFWAWYRHLRQAGAAQTRA